MLEKRVKKYLQIYRNKGIDITEDEVRSMLFNTKKLVNLLFIKFIDYLNTKNKHYDIE